jgi:hypothetical protein
MRNRILKYGSLGIILAALPLVGGWSEDVPAEPHAVPAVTLTNAPAQTNTLSVTQPEPDGKGEPTTASVEQDAAELANAPAQAISTEKPLPPNVKPSESVNEVLRLADSGVDQSVLLAYVNNATNRFNLGADEIIYLNDMGFPGNVVTAMIQHDQAASGIPPATVAPVPDMIAPMGAAPTPDPNQFATDALPPMDATGQYAPMPDSSAMPTDVSSTVPEGYPPPEGAYPYEDGGAPPEVAADSAFYDTLAPYGTWVNVAGYGNCWQPSAVVVDPGWQPYFNCGRWVYSDCGWYWLSGYSWGWAPFHYGRWFRHNRLGWCWAPGRVWGPSWVGWRYSGGYCGWAPLPPCAWYRPGVGLTYRGRAVNSSFGFGLTPQSYAFVAFNNFYHNRLPAVAVPHKQVSGFYRLTTPSAGFGFSHNRVVNNGVPPRTVANFSRVPTHRVAIHEVARTTGSQGGRVEQFASKGSALSVLRPSAPLAAGSKISVRAPQPPAQPRGNGHTFNSQPAVGSPGLSLRPRSGDVAWGNNPGNHVQPGNMNATRPVNQGMGNRNNPQPAAEAQAPTRNTGTTWRDIPRTAQASETAPDAYQRWKQRVTPSQAPWYLPNANSAPHVTEKTSRMENHQPIQSPRALDNGVIRSGPPVNAGISESRGFQYNTPRIPESPKRDFAPQPSFSSRPNIPGPSPRVETRVDVAPRPSPSPAPAQSFSPPVVHSAPAPSAPAPSYTPHNSSGSGRWGR